MPKQTTVTYDGQGNVISRTVTTKSGCGCVTFIAAIVAVFGPIAWFPLWGAVLAYIFEALLLVGAAVAWAQRRSVRPSE